MCQGNQYECSGTQLMNENDGNTMAVRMPETSELELLAKLWFDGWQDAHAQILPAKLARHRTLESFRSRLLAGLADVRVAGPSGEPLGFCMIKKAELYQLYMSANARGSGLAALLLAEAELRIVASEVEVAWLACAIGNERASHFYEKHGWFRKGTMMNELDTPDGIFNLEVWRYEKNIQPFYKQNSSEN
jgi:ribosomal protein S18 acetylase RimI-like enzyme